MEVQEQFHQIEHINKETNYFLNILELKCITTEIKKKCTRESSRFES